MNDIDLEFVPSELRDDLLVNIVQSLQEPEVRTAVSRQYDNNNKSSSGSNHILDDNDCYARLLGKSWTFRIKSKSVTIGRNTDTFDSSLNWTSRAGLDIDLGPSKTVSRNHAKITYDEIKGKWVFTAMGRNGAKINGRKIKPTESDNTLSISIENGSLLEVGGIDILFLVSGQYPEYTQKSVETIATRLYKHFRLNERSINVIENPFVWGIVRNSKYYNNKVRPNFKIPEGTVPVQQVKFQIALEKIKPLKAKKLLENKILKKNTTVDNSDTQQDNNVLKSQADFNDDTKSTVETDNLAIDKSVEQTIQGEKSKEDNETNEQINENCENISKEHDKNDDKNDDKTENENKLGNELENDVSKDEAKPEQEQKSDTIPKWNFYSNRKDSESAKDNENRIKITDTNYKKLGEEFTKTISPISEDPSVPSSKRQNEELQKPDEKRPKLDSSVIYNSVESEDKRTEKSSDRANFSTTPGSSKDNTPNPPEEKVLKYKNYAKPKDSYATLITKAILSSRHGELCLSEILNYISSKHPYFKNSNVDWPNSVRHNLSMNKKFEKVSKKATEIGKGHNWRISATYREEFLQKWRKGTLKVMKKTDAVDRQLLLYVSKNGDLPKRTADDDDDDGSPKRVLVQSMADAPGPSK